MTSESPRARLVVIEFGASWPLWLSLRDTGHSAVVAQHYEGAPGDLVTQVASRLQRLERQGWHVDRIVLVSNGRVDDNAVSARAILARGLQSGLDRRGGGTLTLSVDGRKGRRARYVLSDLASRLDGQSVGRRVRLDVRFDAALDLGANGNARAAG